jgi:hypothetical protein
MALINAEHGALLLLFVGFSIRAPPGALGYSARGIFLAARAVSVSLVEYAHPLAPHGIGIFGAAGWLSQPPHAARRVVRVVASVYAADRGVRRATHCDLKFGVMGL